MRTLLRPTLHQSKDSYSSCFGKNKRPSSNRWPYKQLQHLSEVILQSATFTTFVIEVGMKRSFHISQHAIKRYMYVVSALSWFCSLPTLDSESASKITYIYILYYRKYIIAWPKFITHVPKPWQPIHALNIRIAFPVSRFQVLYMLLLCNFALNSRTVLQNYRTG